MALPTSTAVAHTLRTPVLARAASRLKDLVQEAGVLGPEGAVSAMGPLQLRLYALVEEEGRRSATT